MRRHCAIAAGADGSHRFIGTTGPIESTAKLSDALEISTLELSEASAQRALRAGDLDACRIVLGQCEMPDDERAALYCRLSEALYYGNRREEALDCARAAFGLQPRQQSIADFCAWLFSNCERHQEASAAYQRLLEHSPGWAEGHRHVSGSLAVVGEIDHAISHAVRACEIEVYKLRPRDQLNPGGGARDRRVDLQHATIAEIRRRFEEISPPNTRAGKTAQQSNRKAAVQRTRNWRARWR